MPENSIVRFVSVIAVMLIFGFGWYGISLSRFKKQGMDEAAAKQKAGLQARLCAILAVFIFLLSMISIASIFVER